MSIAPRSPHTAPQRLILLLLVILLCVAVPLARTAAEGAWIGFRSPGGDGAEEPGEADGLYYAFQQGINDYEGCADTDIDGWDPEASSGDAHELRLRRDDTRSVLMRFELADQIAGPVDVVRARLFLYVSEASVHGLEVAIYRVLRPWKEDEATWTQPLAGETWAADGCRVEGVDHAASPSTSFHITEARTTIEIDVTALVEDWLERGETNHGFVFKVEEGPQVQAVFASSEHVYVDLRPELIVECRSTATATITLTPSAAPTATPSPSASPSATRTATRTPTKTVEPKPTPMHWLPLVLCEYTVVPPSPTPNETALFTATPSCTATPSPPLTIVSCCEPSSNKSAGNGRMAAVRLRAVVPSEVVSVEYYLASQTATPAGGVIRTFVCPHAGGDGLPIPCCCSYAEFSNPTLEATGGWYTWTLTSTLPIVYDAFVVGMAWLTPGDIQLLGNGSDSDPRPGDACLSFFDSSPAVREEFNIWGLEPEPKYDWLIRVNLRPVPWHPVPRPTPTPALQ